MFLDSKACYDCILVSLSNIVCQSQGLHEKVASLYTQTVQTIKYHPKHKLGISEEYSGHILLEPFHGVGQRSGNGGTRLGVCKQ